MKEDEYNDMSTKPKCYPWIYFDIKFLPPHLENI